MLSNKFLNMTLLGGKRGNHYIYRHPPNSWKQLLLTFSNNLQFIAVYVVHTFSFFVKQEKNYIY